MVFQTLIQKKHREEDFLVIKSFLQTFLTVFDYGVTGSFKELVPFRGHSLVVKWVPCKRLLSVRFRLTPPLLYDMLHKLRQNTLRYRFTSSNRLPLRRARKFLTNHIRMIRLETSSAPMRAAMGLIR